MSEVIGAFLRTEFGGEGTDPARETRNGSLGCFSSYRQILVTDGVRRQRFELAI